MAMLATDAIDLRELREFFRRHAMLILAPALGVVALAYFALLTVTPTYTAMAKVLLQPHKENLFGTENVLKELSVETANVDSQVSIVTSTNLLRKVVEKEKLTEDPEFSQAKRSFLNVFFDLFKFGSETKEGPARQRYDNPIPPILLRTINSLDKALDVQRVNRTLVLSIAVTSENPDKAAYLANAISDAYVEEQLEASYGGIKRGSAWLGDRLGELTVQLRRSEQDLADYRKANNLYSSSSGGEDKKSLSEEQLSELNGKLVQARAEAAATLAKFQQAVDVASHHGNLEAVPDVLHSAVILELRRQQAEVVRKEGELASAHGDRHPLVRSARAERQQINRAIDAEVKRTLINLENDYKVAHARAESLSKSLDELTGQTGIDSDVGVKLRELERINDANKALFENVISRAKITREQSNFEQQEARIISPATVPDVPSFPKKRLIIGLASIVGLLIGIGGAVASDMLDAGFATALAVGERLHQPVLGSVGFISKHERTVDGKTLALDEFVEAKPHSRYAEAIQAVRVGINMADIDNPPKIILITSSVPGEGKSTLARSLAHSWSSANAKALLIDGDLRRRTITKELKATTRRGLVDYLANGFSLDDVIFQQGGLWILPAGFKSSNPPDILGSNRMKELIGLCRNRFDHVLIDSPPTAAVIDSRVLAGVADKIIYVVQWKATNREIAAQNIEYFLSERKLAGVVLNMVDETKLPRYGAHAQYTSGRYETHPNQ
jgi:exopolysaccharide transport family protein